MLLYHHWVSVSGCSYKLLNWSKLIIIVSLNLFDDYAAEMCLIHWTNQLWPNLHGSRICWVGIHTPFDYFIKQKVVSANQAKCSLRIPINFNPLKIGKGIALLLSPCCLQDLLQSNPPSCRSYVFRYTSFYIFLLDKNAKTMTACELICVILCVLFGVSV